MNPETPKVRANILAVLREATRPLTTAEVADRCEKYLAYQPCHESMHACRNDHCYFISCYNGRDLFLMHVNAGQKCLRELVRFEKRGEVVGHRERGRQAVMWTWAGGGLQNEISALEEAFALPAYEGVR